MAKHVIFLGAGASWTSGYPLAADLRFILSSPERFREYLNDKIDKIGKIGTPKQFELKAELQKAYDSYKDAVELFREGGFATVDEFSYLARERHEVFVQTLKRFTSFIFAIHNPEHWYVKPGAQTKETTTAFLNSDYFPFIQKLFDETLHEFRDDVAVLTYNYDPYLDFLLSRAYRVRKKAAGEDFDKAPTSILSGLGNLDDKNLLKEKGFCFLKLHGTSVLPGFDSHHGRITNHDPLTFYEVFEQNEFLAEKLSAQALSGSINRPPIFFPWELIKDDGRFVSKDKFRAAEGSLAQTDLRLSENGSYYEIFKAIWQRAQKEIIDAEKISFVGLSMHQFLKTGLKFLFQERIKSRTATNSNYTESKLEIVLACPGAMHSGADFRKPPAPNSAAAKLISTLMEVNPLILTYSNGCLQTPIPPVAKSGSGGIVCYEDFSSFIKAEL